MVQPAPKSAVSSGKDILNPFRVKNARLPPIRHRDGITDNSLLEKMKFLKKVVLAVVIGRLSLKGGINSEGTPRSFPNLAGGAGR
jgi:hypothetical protein